MRDEESQEHALGPLAAWSLVAILLLAYALSFVDRQILSLLVGDIRRDLSIGDTQMGLLLGPAFGIFYAVFGMPLGWLADKVDRLRLIAAGLLLWTLATMAGGFADSFAWLAVARMGVGVGEAALVPAAVSLLADAFPAGRRALPLAIFTAGISVGAGAALMLGGSLIAFAADGAGQLPVIGGWLAGRGAWQVVLILAGLAGLPMALAILALPEPRRGVVRGAEAGEGFARYLLDHRGLFAGMFGGTALLYVFSNALAAWMPSLFERGFGWTPAQVGLRIGVVVLVCALLGTLLSGSWATWRSRRAGVDASFFVMTTGALVLAPIAVLAPLAPTAGLVQAGLALLYFALALCFGVATASFVAVTPAGLRGRMIALYLLIGNLCGLGLGPPATGLLLDRVFGDPAKVGAALALLAVPTSVAGAGLLLLMRRAHRVRVTALTH